MLVLLHLLAIVLLHLLVMVLLLLELVVVISAFQIFKVLCITLDYFLDFQFAELFNLCLLIFVCLFLVVFDELDLSLLPFHNQLYCRLGAGLCRLVLGSNLNFLDFQRHRTLPLLPVKELLFLLSFHFGIRLLLL